MTDEAPSSDADVRTAQLNRQVAGVDALLKIAAQRMLTPEDLGLSDCGPDAVRAKCNLIAELLAERYLSSSLTWADADTLANNLYDLMFLHSGSRVPAFAWDIFLAFDEGEVDDRGDGYTRPRVTELMRKHASIGRLVDSDP